jgi:hypothetical protein
VIYRKGHPVPRQLDGNGSPELLQDAIIKSENKIFYMGSLMIIFLIAHLFKKDQAYASLFSSALKEGIRDTFGGEANKPGNGAAKETSMHMVNRK